VTTLTASRPGVKLTDTIEIDQAAHRLYAGDNWSGGVDVFDITRPDAQYVKTIALRGRPRGIPSYYGLKVVPELHKLFVGVSGSVLAVIDIDPASPTSDRVIARLDTGGKGAVDLIDYVPPLRKIYAANRDDGIFVAVDAVRNEIVKTFDGLGPTLEQPCYNPGDGMVYLVSDGNNVLYQIDPVRDEVTRTMPIGIPCNPHGLAIDPDGGTALLGCSISDRPNTVIWDLKTQRVVADITDSGCGDGAIYVPSIGRFLFAAHGFTGGPVLGIFGGDPVRLLANVHTDHGASWVAYDETNRLAYTPTFANGLPALLSFPLPDTG
jgi:DNA-binding beta-propeller fold protein YncE